MSKVILIDDAVNQTQRFTMEGTSYDIRLTWNTRATVWVADIADTDGNKIVSGLALVLGVNPTGHLNLNIGAIAVYDTEQGSNEADLSNFGSTVILVQFTQDEVDGN